MDERLNKYFEDKTVESQSIVSISLDIMSEKEIIDSSVVTVSSSTDESDNGLHSAKLGSYNKEKLCGSCNKNVDQCEMHWGHIRLPESLIYPNARSLVAKLLTAFCSKCRKPNGMYTLAYSDEEINKLVNVSQNKRLGELIATGNNSCKFGKCNFYFAPEKSIRIVKDTKKSGEKGPNVELSMIEVIGHLEKMEKDDLIKLGINVFPATLYVFSTIPVPPIQIRAPDTSIPGRVKSHPLTNALRQIIIAIESSTSSDKMADINKAYVDYLSIKKETKLDLNNDLVIGIKGILDAKKGHMRSNINGKRTDFCARTVISPDPTLKISEIGVPIEIASGITTEETISNININLYKTLLYIQSHYKNTNYISDLYDNYNTYISSSSIWNDVVSDDNKTSTKKQINEAKNKLSQLKNEYATTIIQYEVFNMQINKDFIRTRGGIKYITRNGKQIKINEGRNKKFKLEVGDVVHRTLINGDLVTLNRQPALHKFSIIGGVVVLKDYRTFGISGTVCSGTNADFDGDEMNLSVPQTYIAKADVMALMDMRNCILSEKNGTILNGPIQDAVLAQYIMTQDSTVLTKFDFMNCLTAVDKSFEFHSLESRAKHLGCDPLSGKTLLSSLFPKDFQYTKIYDENKVIKIVDGILVSGIITKNVLSKDDKSILQMLIKYDNGVSAQKYQDEIYKLSIVFFEIRGFSVGYNDCILDQKTRDTIRDVNEKNSIDINSVYKKDDNNSIKQETIVNKKLDNNKARIDNLVKNSIDGQTLRFFRKNRKIVVCHLIYSIGAKIKIEIETKDENPNKIEIENPNEIEFVFFNFNTKIANIKRTNQKDVENIETLNLVGIYVQYDDLYSQSMRWYNQNSFLGMIESGSKGTFNNFVQVAGMVGQQTISDKRIARTMTNEQRTLPHFDVSDRTPRSQGLVEGAYSHGIDPLSFYLHAVGSRQAITETAISTPETGYYSRRLTKLLENNVTQHDGSVRSTPYTFTKISGEQYLVGRTVNNVSGNKQYVGGPIVQFMYGDMGLAMDKLFGINGLKTFSDMKQRMISIQKRKSTEFAYVIFATEQNQKYILVCILSIQRVSSNDIIVCMNKNSNIKLSLQNAIKELATLLVVVPHTSPLWAYNLIDYKQVAIIDPRLILVQRVDSSRSVKTSKSIDIFNFKYLPAMNLFKETINNIENVNKNVLTNQIIDNKNHVLEPYMCVIKPDLHKYKSIQKFVVDNSINFNKRSWAKIMLLFELDDQNSDYVTNIPYNVNLHVLSDIHEPPNITQLNMPWSFIFNDQVFELSEVHSYAVEFWYKFVNNIIVERFPYIASIY